MLRGLFLACMLALSLVCSACDGRRIPVTAFNKGFNAGVDEVRRARQKFGVLGDVAGHLQPLFPGNKGESEQWNAGFRAGVREELNR